MPVAKKSQSALKAARVAGKRQLRNRAAKSAVRTYISKARKLIEAEDTEAALLAVRRAGSALDRAAQKGVLHPNNAARRKARLMKRFNAAHASQPQPQG